MQPANNSAGGILCIWNVHTFKLERKHTQIGLIYLEGTLVAEGVKVNIWIVSQHHERSIKEFNYWIFDLKENDVPCIGRKYTWYGPNRIAKSRLDRFLVFADWLNKWKDTSQFIL